MTSVAMFECFVEIFRNLDVDLSCRCGAATEACENDPRARFGRASLYRTLPGAT